MKTGGRRGSLRARAEACAQRLYERSGGAGGCEDSWLAGYRSCQRDVRKLIARAGALVDRQMRDNAEVRAQMRKFKPTGDAS
jgi:hypothetical protein